MPKKTTPPSIPKGWNRVGGGVAYRLMYVVCDVDGVYVVYGVCIVCCGCVVCDVCIVRDVRGVCCV